MIVIVDTSVWVRALADRAPWRNQLDQLLANRKAAGHDLVFGELLIGNRGGRLKVLESYLLLHQAGTVPHAEVVEFARARKLAGRGAGWVDIHLLASAMVSGMQLWTADQPVAEIAHELKIDYSPPAGLWPLHLASK